MITLKVYYDEDNGEFQLCLLEGKEKLAYADLVEIEDENIPNTYYFGLEIIHVLESHRFKSLGSWLLQEVIKFAREYKYDIQLMPIENPIINLRKWYEKYGFKPIGAIYMRWKYDGNID